MTKSCSQGVCTTRVVALPHILTNGVTNPLKPLLCPMEGRRTCESCVEYITQ